MKFASVGDIIETDVQNPTPGKLFASLDTPEACAHGNYLIVMGRWRLHEPCGNIYCNGCKMRKKDNGNDR